LEQTTKGREGKEWGGKRLQASQNFFVVFKATPSSIGGDGRYVTGEGQKNLGGKREGPAMGTQKPTKEKNEDEGGE